MDARWKFVQDLYRDLSSQYSDVGRVLAEIEGRLAPGTPAGLDAHEKTAEDAEDAAPYSERSQLSDSNLTVAAAGLELQRLRLNLFLSAGSLDFPSSPSANTLRFLEVAGQWVSVSSDSLLLLDEVLSSMDPQSPQDLRLMNSLEYFLSKLRQSLVPAKELTSSEQPMADPPRGTDNMADAGGESEARMLRSFMIEIEGLKAELSRKDGWLDRFYGLSERVMTEVVAGSPCRRCPGHLSVNEEYFGLLSHRLQILLELAKHGVGTSGSDVAVFPEENPDVMGKDSGLSEKEPARSLNLRLITDEEVRRWQELQEQYVSELNALRLEKEDLQRIVGDQQIDIRFLKDQLIRHGNAFEFSLRSELSCPAALPDPAAAAAAAAATTTTPGAADAPASTAISDEEYAQLCDRIDWLHAESAALSAQLLSATEEIESLRVQSARASDLEMMVCDLQEQLTSLLPPPAADGCCQAQPFCISRSVQTSHTGHDLERMKLQLADAARSHKEARDHIAVSIVPMLNSVTAQPQLGVRLEQVSDPRVYRLQLWELRQQAEYLRLRLSLSSASGDLHQVSGFISEDAHKKELAVLRNQIVKLEVSQSEQQQRWSAERAELSTRIQSLLAANKDAAFHERDLERVRLEIQNVALEKLQVMQEEMEAQTAHYEAELAKQKLELGAAYEEALLEQQRLLVVSTTSQRTAALRPSSPSWRSPSSLSGLSQNFSAAGTPSLPFPSSTPQKMSDIARPKSPRFLALRGASPSSASMSAPPIPDRPFSTSSFRRRVRIAEADGVQQYQDHLHQHSSSSLGITRHAEPVSVDSPAASSSSKQTDFDPAARVNVRSLLHRLRDTFDRYAVLQDLEKREGPRAQDSAGVTAEERLSKILLLAKESLKLLLGQLQNESSVCSMLSEPASFQTIFDWLWQCAPSLGNHEELFSIASKIFRFVVFSRDTIAAGRREPNLIPLLTQMTRLCPVDVAPAVRQLGVLDDFNKGLLPGLPALMLHLTTTRYAEEQRDLLKAVISLGFSDDGKALLRKNGCVGAVIKVAKKTDNVKTVAAQFLMVLSTDPDNRVEIRKKGGIELCVELLERTKEIAACRFAAGCLLNLSVNEMNKEVIRDVGGVPALLRVLPWCSDLEVKSYVLRCLSNLSVLDDIVSDILKLSGLQLICSNLQAQDTAVVGHAIRLLILLCRSSEFGSSLAAKYVSSVCMLLEQPSSVFDDAIVLLSSLCVFPETRVALFRDGHLAKVVHALRQSLTDAGLEPESQVSSRRAACLSIVCFVSSVREALPQLIKLGAAGIAFKTLLVRDAAGSAMHRRESAFLIANLASCPEFLPDAVIDDRMNIMCRLMREDDDVVASEVLRYFLPILSATNQPETASIMDGFKSAGGFENLAHALHRKVVLVTVNALKIIATIAGRKDFQDVFVANDATGHLMDSLQVSRVSILADALSICRSMVPNEACRSAFLDHDIIELLLDLLSSTNDDLHRDVSLVLQEMCSHLDGLDEFVGSGGLDVLADIFQAGSLRSPADLLRVVVQVSADPDYLPDVLQHEVFRATVFEWLNDHTPAIVSLVLQLMNNIATLEPGRQLIRQHRKMKRVLMLCDSLSADIWPYAFSLIARLSLDIDGMQELLLLGGLSTFTAALSRREEEVGGSGIFQSVSTSAIASSLGSAAAASAASTLRATGNTSLSRPVAAAKVLIAVASHPDGILQLMRRGGIEDAIQALRAEPESQLVQHILILVALLAQNSTVAAALASSEVFLLLASPDIMTLVTADDKTCEYTLRLLANVGKVASTNFEIDDRILDFVLRAFDRYGSKADHPLYGPSRECMRTLRMQPALALRIDIKIRRQGPVSGRSASLLDLRPEGKGETSPLSAGHTAKARTADVGPEEASPLSRRTLSTRRKQ